MKSEIQEVVNNIICKTIIGVLVFGFLNFLFLHLLKGYPNIKETWSNMVGFSSAAATLGAAWIASHLFNDWKEQHNKQVFSSHATTVAVLLCKDRRILDAINFELKKDSPYGDREEFIGQIHDIAKNLESSLSTYMFFSRLINDSEEFFKIISKYFYTLDSISIAFSENRNQDPKDYHAKIDSLRSLSEEALTLLKSFILIGENKS